MREQFEEWLKQQYFYLTLRYRLGDSIFLYDKGIGYRNETVQIAYIAFYREDPEFVL